MIAKTRLLNMTAVCVLAVLAGTHARAEVARETIADLAGTWILEQKPAEGPEKPPEGEGRGDRGGGPGGMGGGLTGSIMGFGGQGGGPPDRAKIERHRRIAQAELASPRRIVITSADKQLVVTADDGRPEALVPDGKKHLRLTGDGEINTTTRWANGVLTTERHYDEGITARRTYHVEPVEGAGRQLVVTLKLEGGGMLRKAPEIRRVYRLQS